MTKAFTLLELLVVVAIMAMMGIASSGGYNAMVRGMQERGTVASASAVLRSAKERALIDRVPTAVFCYNRMLHASTASSAASVVGEMVAVRRSGRLSYVRGKYLFDEFGDLDISYEKTDDESELKESGGMRLYRFGGKRMNQMLYSIVADAVYSSDRERLFTFTHGYTNQQTCAFYNLNKSDREPPAWRAGDAYGFEFAELQLPDGYIFGSEIPTDPGRITTPTVLYFDPEQDGSVQSIDVWSTRTGSSGRPDKFRKAGEARSDDRAV